LTHAALTRYVLELAAMLLVILIAAELFTNALEHLGERLRISEGVTGSVFAAVGTALPETMVPLIALLAGSANAAVDEEIGVGAILGAPLMLSTLSTALMGLAVLRARGPMGLVRAERSGLVRDLNAFVFAFVVATLAMFVPVEFRYGRVTLSLFLVVTYVVYLLLTIRASAGLVRKGHGTETDERLFLSRFGLRPGIAVTLLQLALALCLLVGGAKGFIDGVEGLSTTFGLSALLLSLIVIPIATELPEKVNSILWIRRGKDTLAFGNITGALVFQSTLLPAIGITLTPWQPRFEVLGGALATLAAAIWLRLGVRATGVRVWVLLVNGTLYLAFLVFSLAR